jgi:hypothetical protein
MAGQITISTLKDDAGVLATQNGMTGIAKAWVNFDGTGTPAIRASFNVSSITDNGTGDYTVNFTTAMPNANYAVAGIAMYPTSTNSHFVSYGDSNGAAGTLPTTSAFRLRTMYAVSATNAQDCAYVVLSVFSS